MPPIQNQPPTASPSSLPPLAPRPETPQPQPGHGEVPSAMSGAKRHTGSELSIAAQAKALVLQYKSNPYQLNVALQQLKIKYLSEHFGINPDQGQK